MLLKVDTSNSIPVYSQIVNQIKHAIASGILRSGEFLPSLRDTARDLRINPHTVAKAYRELEILGLVRTDHGRGTCVTADGVQLSKERRHEQLRRRQPIRAGMARASPTACRRSPSNPWSRS